MNNRNKTIVAKKSSNLFLAIFLYSVILCAIHVSKPSLFYLPDESFRRFGVGYARTTVVPVWVAAILVAILSYTFASLS